MIRTFPIIPESSGRPAAAQLPKARPSLVPMLAAAVLACDILYWLVHAWATFLHTMKYGQLPNRDVAIFDKSSAPHTYTEGVDMTFAALLPMAPQLILLPLGAGALLVAKSGRYHTCAILATAVVYGAAWLAAKAYLAFVVAVWRMVNDRSEGHCQVYSGLVSPSLISSKAKCSALNIALTLGHALYFLWSVYKCCMFSALVTRVLDKVEEMNKKTIVQEVLQWTNRTPRRITRRNATGTQRRSGDNSPGTMQPPPYFDCYSTPFGADEPKNVTRVTDTV